MKKKLWYGAHRLHLHILYLRETKITRVFTTIYSL